MRSVHILASPALALALAGLLTAPGAPGFGERTHPSRAPIPAPPRTGSGDAVDPGQAVAWATGLVAQVTPEQLQRELATDGPEYRRALGQALAAAPPRTLGRLQELLAACARARGRALARRGTWAATEAENLLALLVVEPDRFAGDAEFRRRVQPVLEGGLDPEVPPALRDDVLYLLNRTPGVDFPLSEAVETAWGAARRRSLARQVEMGRPAGLTLDDDPARSLSVSIYSLPSTFFEPPEVVALLRAVRRHAPGRLLITLTDLPMRRQVSEQARQLGVRLVETYGRGYSPWPRDPFTFFRAPGGRVVALVRPNLQSGREVDATMLQELIQGLPEDVDRGWGEVEWGLAPVPFHNGHVLQTSDAAWISIHSLEVRILELLGLPKVPVESFHSSEGIDAYLGAARRAASELADLYRRPVRFVHPLPEEGSAESRGLSMDLLGGGAGYDLDSWLTLLPSPDGGVRALIGDLAAGAELAAGLDGGDLDALAQGYRLGTAGDELRQELVAAQRLPQARAFAAFLDLVAAHLESSGMEVFRLPLLRVPTAMMADPSAFEREHFLLTWNNVVVEGPRTRIRAEGFSSLLTAGDRRAQEVFGEAGTELVLLPPLLRSIVLGGGYRCASNHLRGRSSE